MWEWLQSQAQQASPFIATFCLLTDGLLVYAIKLGARQLLLERSEHRISEKETAIALRDVGVALQALATSQDTMNKAVIPLLVQLASQKAEK